MHPDSSERIHLVMLREIYDLGLKAAGEVWPTPEMALGRLFERGTDFLEGDATLAKITGAASPDLLDGLNVCREDLFLVEALHYLTQYVTYALTEAGNVLEAT